MYLIIYRVAKTNYGSCLSKKPVHHKRIKGAPAGLPPDLVVKTSQFRKCPSRKATLVIVCDWIVLVCFSAGEC